jgi:peptidoglycan/LPS O-acetylase OafA/YrhL
MKSIRLVPRTLSVAASAHLDLIRAAAASAVMWGHLRTLFFVDFQHLRHSDAVLKVIYFLTGFGHQAVIVFFVLSGFLISATVIKSHASGTLSWPDYAINRLVRLYVVLAPGLLFGLLWDKTGSSLFASTGLYLYPLDGLGPGIAEAQMTFGNFFGNLFFLQTIICPTFGSNAPLWSLANEFWYYVLFPVVLCAGLAWTRHRVRRAIALTLLAFCFVVFLGSERLIGFLIWMTGCALLVAYSKIRLPANGWLFVCGLLAYLALIGCLIAARSGRSAVFGSDLAVWIACSLFLFSLLQLEFEPHYSYYSRTAHLFAGFSYSLYVLHFPLLLFLRAWIVPSKRWQPDAAHLFCALIVGATVLGFAWLVAVFTENKTHLVRSWIRNRIHTIR